MQRNPGEYEMIAKLSVGTNIILAKIINILLINIQRTIFQYGLVWKP